MKMIRYVVKIKHNTLDQPVYFKGVESDGSIADRSSVIYITRNLDDAVSFETYDAAWEVSGELCDRYRSFGLYGMRGSTTVYIDRVEMIINVSTVTERGKIII